LSLSLRPSRHFPSISPRPHSSSCGCARVLSSPFFRYARFSPPGYALPACVITDASP
jgi:hypothetical protein